MRWQLSRSTSATTRRARADGRGSLCRSFERATIDLTWHRWRVVRFWALVGPRVWPITRERSWHLLDESMAIWTQVGDTNWIATVGFGLGMTHRLAGDPARAGAALATASELTDGLGIDMDCRRSRSRRGTWRARRATCRGRSPCTARRCAITRRSGSRSGSSIVWSLWLRPPRTSIPKWRCNSCRPRKRRAPVPASPRPPSMTPRSSNRTRVSRPVPWGTARRGTSRLVVRSPC